MSKVKKIHEEDKYAVYALGLKVTQAKRLHEQIVEFLVKDGESVYDFSEKVLGVLEMYIDGETLDSIGEAVFQSDRTPVIEILKFFSINFKES